MFPLSTGRFHKISRLGAFALAIGVVPLLAFGSPASAVTIGLDFTLTQAQADAAGTSDLRPGNKGAEF